MADNAVATPSQAYEEQRPHWAIIDAVRSGTPAMRASPDFLPKEPMEDDQAYKRRRGRTVFTPWYERLVTGLVGMVLRKPIALPEGLSEELAAQLEDVNLQGDNLQLFATELLETAIDYGYAAIFVDYPDTSSLKTRRDETDAGVRPYWVMYRANEIIGYRTVQHGSTEVLTQLRVIQTITEEKDEFGEVTTQQVRVYDRDENGQVSCRLFRPADPEKADGDWVLHEGPLPITLPFIPCVLLKTAHKKRVSPRPPMLEVAYLNLKHYQISSDLDHALHMTLHPKLALFGYEQDSDVLATSDEALVFTNVQARAEWLVCDVGSLQFGSDRIAKIERQMATLGLSTIVADKQVGETAEAKRIDRSQGDSIMAVIAQNLQNALNRALEFHAAYLQISEPPICSVNRDFSTAQITPQMLSALTQAVSQGMLSTQTFHEILKMGEVGLPGDWSPAKEGELLAAEFKAEAETMPQTNIDADL